MSTLHATCVLIVGVLFGCDDAFSSEARSPIADRDRQFRPSRQRSPSWHVGKVGDGTARHFTDSDAGILTESLRRLTVARADSV